MPAAQIGQSCRGNHRGPAARLPGWTWPLSHLNGLGPENKVPGLTPLSTAELFPQSRVDPIALNQLAPWEYFKNPCEE